MEDLYHTELSNKKKNLKKSFQGNLCIGNMLVFTIIFDIYDTYGAEVSDHMSLPYSFAFNYHK